MGWEIAIPSFANWPNSHPDNVFPKEKPTDVGHAE